VIALIWKKPGKLAGATAPKGAAAENAAADLAERASHEIKHPALQVLGISRVVIVGISLPEEGPIPQSRVINFKCLEYVPTSTTPQTAKIKGAVSQVKVAKELQAPNFAPVNAAKKPPSATQSGPKTPRTPASGGS
jgi:hypothetical protein